MRIDKQVLFRIDFKETFSNFCLTGTFYLQYIRGTNCPKSLWLYVHKRDQQVISEATRAIFERGTCVGELAQKYSIHQQDERAGPVRHSEYLAPSGPGTDPRSGLIEQLIDYTKNVSTRSTRPGPGSISSITATSTHWRW